MNLFWLFTAALLALAWWLVAGAPLRRSTPRLEARSARQVNLEVLRAQLRQLDDDLAAGGIDAAQHAQSRADIERRVLEEESVAGAPSSAGSRRGTLALVLLAVPVLALGLYATLGNQRALSPEALQAKPATPQDVEVLLARLAERMAKQPPGRVEDAEGWAMLGRTYAALQRYPLAGQAFARALELTPRDAQLWADQADVTAMQQGQSLRGEPARLVAQALQLDPKNLKALALAGSVAFEQQDFDAAIKHWSAAAALAPPDSDFGKGLQGSLAEAQAARAARGGANVAAAPVAGAASAAASGAAALPGPGVRGRISLSPELAARVAPDDTVFIFARAADGPRMPLAILKRQARELPISFSLDDSQAMSPQMKLSNFASVVVGARISKSGNATPQSGDLQGQAGPLASHGGQAELVIDSVRP